MIKKLRTLGLVLVLSACAAPKPKTTAPVDFDRIRASQARLNLAMAYLGDNDMHLAYRNFLKALEYAPDSIEAQLGMALYEQRIGDVEAVRRRYIQLLPKKNSIILNHYGAFLCSIGDYQNGLVQLKEALALKDYEFTNELLQNAGLCAIKAGDEKEARRYYSQLLTQSPAFGQQLLVISDGLIAEGLTQKATLLISLFEEHLGSSPASLWQRLRIAKLENRYEDVSRYGEQLAHKFPSSHEYRRYLAHEY